MDDTNDLVMDATEARDEWTCQTMSVDLPVLTFDSSIYVAIQIFLAKKNEKSDFFKINHISGKGDFQI